MLDGAARKEESIGERLRRLRNEKGLSQRELTVRGVGPSYLSRIEAGERRPSHRALKGLAARLGVSAEYLEHGRTLRPEDERELRLVEAEIGVHLGDDPLATERELRELREEAGSAGDVPLFQRAEIALGLVAFRTGRHEEAIGLLERVVNEDWITPTARPDAYLSLGGAYLAINRPTQAVELYEEVLVELEQRVPEDQELRIRFLISLIDVLSVEGESDRIRELFSDIDPESFSTDPHGRARRYLSLARLDSIAGRTPRALSQLGRALALLEVTGESLDQARAHLAAAEILLVDREAEKAGPHLARAERLFENGASARDLGALRAKQAKRAALLGDAENALALATEALGYLEEHEGERGTADHALALAYTQKGETDSASAHFARAVEELSARGKWREALLVCQDWAAMLRKAKRDEEAFAVLTRATELAMRRTSTSAAASAVLDPDSA